MALVLVDNASLDSAVAAENATQFGFGTSDTWLVQDLSHLAGKADEPWTYVTPPTNRVRLRTLMWPAGSDGSNSTHFSCWKSLGGEGLRPWRRGLRWR